MPSKFGLEWDDTAGGKLTEGDIPNPPDHKTHYLYDQETKGESSYPLVGGENNLRRGNVESAYQLGARGQAEKGRHDEMLRELGGYFDNNPIPEKDEDMTTLNVVTHQFAEYQYETGSWVERDWQGGEVYGKIRDRTKDSFTVEGNTISGDDDEPVYKFEEYDTDAGEMTGQMIAAPQSGLSSWSGPENMAKSPAAIEKEVMAQDFAMDREQIFSMWNEMTNMEEAEMEMWDNHPCADAGIDNGENIRDETLMLMGQAPNGWDENSYRIANKHLAHISQAMRMEPPDDAMSGGPGTCPHRWATNLLARGVNPLDEMPSGNPEFDTELNTNSISLPEYDESKLQQFAKHGDEENGELDDVYSEWSEHVNMSASQLESWADHPCSDTASRDPEAVRKRNMRLLEKNKSDWTADDIKDAKRTISFISRMRGQKPDEPSSGGKGTCPSEWAVSLLNWAYNPFDGMPDGEPEPEENNADGGAGLVYDDDGKPVEMSFDVSAALEPLTDGFNEYGIKRNTDEQGNLVSVDALFEAMEPGEPKDRNGVRITEDFLQQLAEKDYSDDPPYLMDHERATSAHVGFVKDVWYDDDKQKLMVQARAFNTGAESTNEVVNRLTHEPPLIRDGSVGLGKAYEASVNEDSERELVDGTIQEFSTTPFPGGYDDGGLRASTDPSAESG